MTFSLPSTSCLLKLPIAWEYQFPKTVRYSPGNAACKHTAIIISDRVNMKAQRCLYRGNKEMSAIVEILQGDDANI